MVNKHSFGLMDILKVIAGMPIEGKEAEDYGQPVSFSNLQSLVPIIQAVIKSFESIGVKFNELNIDAEKLVKSLDSVSRNFRNVELPLRRRFSRTELTPAGAGLERLGTNLEVFGRLGFKVFGDVFSPLTQAGLFLQRIAPIISSQLGAVLLGPGVTAIATAAVAVLSVQMVSAAIASVARKVLETGGPVGVSAVATAGFGEMFDMFKRMKGLSMQVAGLGMSMEELSKTMSMLQRSAIETGEGIRMLGVASGTQVVMARKMLMETFPAIAGSLKALETATGITASQVDELRKVFLRLAPSIATSWSEVIMVSGVMYKRLLDINKSLGDVGFSFEEYKDMLIRMSEGGRFFGVNLNTASTFLARFARELREGVVVVNEVTEAFKRLVGETSMEGQIKRITAAMMFGPSELQSLIAQVGGPVQAIPIFRILQSTAYRDLGRAIEEYRRAGYEDVANVLTQIRGMGEQSYNRYQVALRTFLQSFGPLMSSMFGGGPLGMLLGEVLGQGFNIPTFYPTGAETVYRTGATAAATRALAGRPAEPVVVQIARTPEEEAYVNRMLDTALSALEKKATFFDKIGRWIGKGLFGKDFKDAVRAATRTK